MTPDAPATSAPPPSNSPPVRQQSVGAAEHADALSHRVRFSEEIERLPPRNVATQLTVKPRAARNTANDLLEDSASPSSASYPPLAHSSTGQSRLSVISERTRARGYSLRRSLFNKSINEQPEDPTAPIELGQVSSSNGITTEHISHYAGKKSMEATVKEEPIYDHESSKSDSIPPKIGGIQGISALPNYEKWIRQKAQRNRLVRKIRHNFTAVRKFVLRIAEIPPSKDGRHIEVDAKRKERLIDERVNRPFIGNSIRSSRYNAWNFLPRQLFAQFSKIANFYFLCVSIMQMIPGLSTTGTYTTILPLLFFVSISMAKEGYDDFRRYRLDKEENNREASILHVYEPTANASPTEQLSAVQSVGPIHWAKKKWKDIHVGDIIKLERDQAVPADMILLHSEGENGVAYIETMALDGETNLKSKQAVPSLARLCSTLDKIAVCRAELIVEDPNLDLYNFEGKVLAGGETSPLSNADVIYRGSMLRNTSEATGIVIYSGEECKIRMNANSNPRIKAPSLQAVVNKIILLIVVFVLALAIGNTCAFVSWNNNAQPHTWYLKRASVGFGTLLVSFIIMFNTMIPLSLYVSMEIIKVLQMLLLNDIDMYDIDSNTPLEARTSTINEELGQITHVFSDKTGTLTDNSMKFRKLSVAGTAWLHDSDLKLDAIKAEKSRNQLYKKRNKGKTPARLTIGKPSNEWSRHSGLHSPTSPQSSSYFHTGPPVASSGWKSSARPTKAQPEMKSVEMLHYIQRRPNTAFARKAKLFLLSLALCHTCLPEKKEDGTISFQAASPDELALVQAAQEMGYLVMDRQHGLMTIKTFPNGNDSEPLLEVYEVLDVIEFSSKRKRMSVVVKFPDKRICVICKGADTILMQLLRLSKLAIQKTVEIEKRAAHRRSIEAHQAIVRRSEQIEQPARHGSINVGRTSISLARPSVGGGRNSVGGSRLHPLRDQVDTWLSERERDVDASSFADEVDAYYSPRPSGQFGRPSGQYGRPSGPFGRPSTAAASDMRTSYDTMDDYDLVEEALVIDEPAVIERCFQHINDFATEGLRTLLYTYRFLDDAEYVTWKRVYKDATTSLVNRQKMIEKAGELIERDFELAGATAIEDKLQKGVPDTIDKLRRANIKMWMLTGDKRETAINIGHSCRLIKDYSSVTILDHESGQVEQAIAAAIVEVNRGSVAHSVVVVDGQTLSMIDTDHGLQKLFYDLAIITDSVICCRASPAQKAGLVKAIRRKVKSSITLAIGDGANDIAMIQEAHVGIGITGKEGLQAARTSDYSIAQFRFLSKLLLVHGRWNYIRTCKYILATFWKEMTFYLIQALYQRYTGYTGTSLYESWSLSMFNTLFTSLPVIFIGVFEKDLNAATLLAVPELYVKGQRNGGFNIYVYLCWMAMAVVEACIVFYGMVQLVGLTSIRNNDLFALGNLCFTAVVALTNYKLQFIEMHTISVANLIAAGVSTGGWMLWLVFLSVSYSTANLYHVKHSLFRGFGHDLRWWATLIFLVAALLLLEILVKVLKAAFVPTDTDVFQALEQDPATRRRFEQASKLELQQGWEASGYTGADDKMGEEEAQEARVQEEREGEVEEMLRRRGVFDDVALDEHPISPVSPPPHQQQQERKRSLVARKSLGELFKGGGVSVGIKEL